MLLVQALAIIAITPNAMATKYVVLNALTYACFTAKPDASIILWVIPGMFLYAAALLSSAALRKAGQVLEAGVIPNTSRLDSRSPAIAEENPLLMTAV